MNIIISYEKKIKNDYIKSGILEYKKRLSRFCNVEIRKRKISKKSYVILISRNAKTVSSEQFAKKVNDITLHGKSEIIIIFDEEQKFDYSMNLFNIEIDDEILVLLLYEQIYRVYKINNNETYHK